jgi:hypothetical protein
MKPPRDHTIARALCAIQYYEGRLSGRNIAPEFAVRYRRADLISYGPPLRDVIASLKRAYPKCTVTGPVVRRVLKMIEQRKAGFRKYTLPDERPRGVFK